MKKSELAKNTIFCEDKTKVTISFSKDLFDENPTKDNLNMLLTRAYIRFNCTASGKVCTTLNAITAGCGNSIKSNSKESNDKFRSCLIYLQDHGYITCDKCIASIKNGEYFEFQIRNINMIYCDKNFVLLNQYEFETIISSRSSVNKGVLLNIYLYLKKNIYYNNLISYPRLSIAAHDDIRQISGVSSVTTLKRALNDLHDIGLLYWNKEKYYYYDTRKKTYKVTKNVYALSESDLEFVKCNLEDAYQTMIYLRDEVPGDKIFDSIEKH